METKIVVGEVAYMLSFKNKKIELRAQRNGIEQRIQFRDMQSFKRIVTLIEKQIKGDKK